MSPENQEFIASSTDNHAPHESNNQEKGAANLGRAYWFSVNIAWVVLVIQMLLCTYLVFGPNFWKEFFK